jgi:hypothetical protein
MRDPIANPPQANTASDQAVNITAAMIPDYVKRRSSDPRDWLDWLKENQREFISIYGMRKINSEEALQIVFKKNEVEIKALEAKISAALKKPASAEQP